MRKTSTRPEFWAVTSLVALVVTIIFTSAPADAQQPPCETFSIDATAEFWAFDDWELLTLTLDDGRQLQFSAVTVGQQFTAPEGALFVAITKCVTAPEPEVTPSPTPVTPTPSATPETPSPTATPIPSPTSPPESFPSPTPTVSPTSTPDSSPSPTPEPTVPEPTTTAAPTVTPTVTPSQPSPTPIPECRPKRLCFPDPCLDYNPPQGDVLGIDCDERPERLPETGAGDITRVLAFIGGCALITGLALVGLRRADR